MFMNNNLYESLATASQSLEGMTTLLSNINGEMIKLNDTCLQLAGSLSYSFSDAISDTSNIVSMIASYDTLSNLMKGLLPILNGAASQAAGFGAQILGVLSAVGATGPILGFGAALAGVTVVFGGLDYWMNESTRKTQAYVEELNKKRDALHNNTEEMKKNTEAAVNNANSIQADYGNTLNQIDELVKLSGMDGYAGNIEKARYLAEQINQVLPNSVQITEDGKVAWQGNSEAVQDNIQAIKDNIKELERKALMEAYQKDYAEALKNQAKYEADLTSAKKAQKEAQEKVNEAQKAANEYTAEHGHNSVSLQLALANANSELTAQNEVLYEAQSQFAQNEKAISLYTNAYDSLDGNIASSAKLQAEMYTEMGERGTSSWKSLSNALSDLDAKQEEHLAKGLDASSQEVQVTTQTAELIRQQCIEKAMVFGKSYDDMIAILEDKGVALSDNEKLLLEQQYDNYQASSVDKAELQQMGFDQMLTQLEESGLSLTEVEKSQLAQQYLNWDESSKAKEGIQALSYETMLAYLEESGVQLNETEKNHLQQQYQLWDENAKKLDAIEKEKFNALRTTLNTQFDGMNEDQRSKLATSVDILAKGGTTGGYELCQKLSASLADNQGDIDDETKKIIDQVNALASDADPRIDVGTNAPSDSEVKNISKNTQDNLDPVHVGVGISKIAKGFEIAGKIFGLNIITKADGGFVDTGELFVAREAGPELVGRINGKTAVANNDQIVSGISSGVYNAMVGALGSSHRANTTVTAIFQVDGKQVAKQVIKAHNKEVIQTGRSPLLI